jgi:probable F420-dependent oxidoreductase
MRVFTALPMTHWREAGPAARAAEDIGFDVLRTAERGMRCSSRLPLPFTWLPSPSTKRDYIGALRAIWRCWETRGKLDYHIDHYTLTLMTPAFSPEPTGLPMVPVTISAVGEAMLRVAGQVADGVRLHPLCSRRYLLEVCLPLIAEGLARSGRAREHLDVHGGGFVVTGPDAAALARAMDRVRERIAFYCSTRTYFPVLALHGLEELGQKLHRMSVAGRWHDMAAEVSDDIVRIFAACATYDGLAQAIVERFGDAADSIDLEFPAESPPGLQRELLAEIRRIPHRFTGFDTTR